MNSTESFIEDYNNIEKFPTIAALADKYEVHKRTIGKWVSKFRDSGVELIDRSSIPNRSVDFDPCGVQGEVQGTSVLYDSDGNVKLQWVKTANSEDDLKKVMESVSEGFKSSLPKAKPIKAEKDKKYLSDLVNQYTITDYHLGMLAWHEETGADWDIDISRNLLLDWFATAIDQAPKSETAIFAQLGDFLHFDGMEAITPTSGHILDADSRFQKVVRETIVVLRKVIDMMLQKHKTVHIIMAEGNHDLATSVWLREWLSAFYDNEPRVVVDNSATPYYCYEFGDTALFYHHGHKRKVANIDTVFAAMFREVFGRTKNAYAHMGHLHSVDVRETNLMLVEQHRTLAAPDAYAARGGWLSGRDAKVITYHKRYGEVNRITISPDMVKNF